MIENPPKQERRNLFWMLLAASILFFVVYVIIHVLLNFSAANQASECPCAKTEAVQAVEHSSHKTEARPDEKLIEKKRATDGLAGLRRFIQQSSGPVTISICSSLLIFSYGLFLLHGLKHFLISAPYVLLKAFLIFIYGQISIQILGHIEIYVYMQLYDNNPNTGSDPLFQFFWEPLSAFSYTLPFACLYWLELYAERVFSALKEQIPQNVDLLSDTKTMSTLTLCSIFLLGGKFLIIKFDEEGAGQFAIAALVLLVEFGLAFQVVRKAYQRIQALDAEEIP